MANDTTGKIMKYVSPLLISDAIKYSLNTDVFVNIGEFEDFRLHSNEHTVRGENPKEQWAYFIFTFEDVEYKLYYYYSNAIKEYNGYNLPFERFDCTTLTTKVQYNSDEVMRRIIAEFTGFVQDDDGCGEYYFVTKYFGDEIVKYKRENGRYK